MKKFSISMVIFTIMMLVFYTAPLFAKDTGPYNWSSPVDNRTEPVKTTNNNIYIGIGGSYALADFKVNEEVSDFLGYFGMSDDFENTTGINLKIGYHVDSIFALEFNIDGLSGFEWEESGTYNGSSIDAGIDIVTFTIAAKISPDFGSEVLKPFIVVGVGIMHSELTVKASTPGYAASASDSNTGTCFKAGAGLDIFVRENISVGFELAYVIGLVDLAIEGQRIIDECKYMNCTVGVAYHF